MGLAEREGLRPFRPSPVGDDVVPDVILPVQGGSVQQPGGNVGNADVLQVSPPPWWTQDGFWS